MTLDEWSTEQCGVDSINLKNANDREIVREHFKITTMYRPAGWIAMQNKWTQKINIAADEDDSYVCLNGMGKTIAEAEIACISAIREAQE